jgi:LPS export ABC transporter protein LptC
MHKKEMNILINVFIVCFLILQSACSNELETINSIVASDTIPVLSSKNFYMTRSDSGKINMLAKAKLIQYIETANDSFTLFPKGIEVQTFSDYPNVESLISANYAKHYASKKLWEVRNNVVARNYKGDTLYTELLYWDEKKKTIYSNKFARIITKDGVLVGKNGFEADESLTKWKLINTEGTVNVKDN